MVELKEYATVAKLGRKVEKLDDYWAELLGYLSAE